MEEEGEEWCVQFAGWIAIDLGVQTREGRREKGQRVCEGVDSFSSGALWVQFCR